MNHIARPFNHPGHPVHSARLARLGTPRAGRSGFRASSLLALALTLAGLALLASCAPKSAHEAFPGATPEAAWQAFQASRSPAEADRSFTLKASVNYSSPKRSNRLLLSFWGDYDYPLRLDVSAGMGTPIGFWREAQDGFLAYYPAQETAFTHEDGRAACAAMGFETPFNLRELASVLSGRYDDLLPERYAKASSVRDGFEYRLPKGYAATSLVLDPQGRPLRLIGVGQAREPWVVEFKDYAPARPEAAETAPAAEAGQTARPAREIPMTVVISRGETKGEEPAGESATLRVKRFESSPAGAPAASLTLALPPGTAVKRLDETCPLPDVTS